MNIVVVSGSIAGSTTRAAMQAVVAAITTLDPGAEVRLLDLADLDVQFADGRDFLDYRGDTRVLADALLAADAIIIGTPIFQASIPGALKNVFDLLPVGALEDKVVGMLVTAGSPKHFLVAEHQLRPILTYMKAQVVPGYVFVEATDVHRGEIVSDDVAFRIRRLAEDTLLLTQTYSRLRAERDAAYAFA